MKIVFQNIFTSYVRCKIDDESSTLLIIHNVIHYRTNGRTREGMKKQAGRYESARRVEQHKCKIDCLFCLHFGLTERKLSAFDTKHEPFSRSVRRKGLWLNAQTH